MEGVYPLEELRGDVSLPKQQRAVANRQKYLDFPPGSG